MILITRDGEWNTMISDARAAARQYTFAEVCPNDNIRWALMLTAPVNVDQNGVPFLEPQTGRIRMVFRPSKQYTPWTMQRGQSEDAEVVSYLFLNF